MIELITEEQLNNILQAIEKNQNYSFNKNGLNINLEADSNSISIQISYENELDKFQNFLNSLEDDLFVEVCEYLDSDTKKIDEALNSGNIEKIYWGISMFNNALNIVINNKIEKLKSIHYE